ncbi:ModD protein [Gloeothece verrucosa]|uniref:Putative pyrophosphorylase ModD n=1 Tax=Gloeothece verrucosa (strain PCC 7822) TaxID=497965 RepID=E0U5Q4_GLOV7|nr:ModD protein [Gloeothece verrucosa]ADN15895.1 modD protein [Gloeothece verrucosa PCC 7822]
MNIISDQYLWQLLNEDVPYFDLTTQALGIGDFSATITYTTRHETTLCCTEEAANLLKRVGAEVSLRLPSGYQAEKGVTFLIANGSAASLHLGWKCSQNLLEYTCGIATKTHQLVQLAQQVNPDIMLYTTRKSIPGTKPIAIKAILAGGAYPHRLGISETILIFEQHLIFLGGIEGLCKQLTELKRKVKEKKILVEVTTLSEALPLAQAKIDGLQFDKLKAEELADIVPKLKSIHPTLMILAAGGINEANIAEYATTGVDGLVLTAPYYAKPADIQVKISSHF